ncbi:agmatine ureohydrolase [Histoplasma capsulatum G186AR]|uniref:Agmatine ureohydrolase n=1 Tax=Ajellomyces capsulatus TaxID=5037 RepID=A0A8H7Z4Y5_AJECA|nr:agmatine ureohydrolase [Histoplasma capsulatum]QSS69822.1 agmatine ureohydrolase [Histoplasma capsulatum G186AR]
MLLRSWTSILGGFLLYYVNPIYTHDGHDYSDREKSSIDRREELLKKWDQEWSFSGVSTFAHLKHVKCLLEPDEHYDIAILGAPFDTSVSFRPGARFGPRAIRAASARQLPANSYNTRAAINPYLNWARILDCGGIPIMLFDNGVAERQMYEAFLELGTREAPNPIPGAFRTESPRLSHWAVITASPYRLFVPCTRSTENRSPCCTSMRRPVLGVLDI